MSIEMRPSNLPVNPYSPPESPPNGSATLPPSSECSYPEKRGPEPKTGSVASQPKVQVTDSGKNRLRTYRSLLQNETDQKRFEYFFTGQLAKVSVDSGRVNNIGKPAMISGINASPKGDYVRVATIQKPFSYIVPASNFGSKEEIWDANGKSLFTLTDVKLRSGEPAPDPAPTTGTAPAAAPQTGATADARRQLSWMPDGSGLYFIRTKPKPAIPPHQLPHLHLHRQQVKNPTTKSIMSKVEPEEVPSVRTKLQQLVNQKSSSNGWHHSAKKTKKYC